MRVRRLRAGRVTALAVGITAFAVAGAAAATPASTSGLNRTIGLRGAVTPHAGTAPSGGHLGAEIAPEPFSNGGGAPEARHLSRRKVNVRTMKPANVRQVQSRHDSLQQSFDGLNHFDQRFANNGNQYSLEPPDQGLCVGHGFVVETINDVFRVFNRSGHPVTPVIDLNTFYGYPAQIDRTTGVGGPFLTDPTCIYDVDTQRFYNVVLTIDEDGTTNHLDLAVSATADPTGAWNIYSLPVTDDGTNGTPTHANCPCIGDYPHIGADRNGIYITTNEYPFGPGDFNGAQIYVASKSQLAAGASSVNVVQFENTRVPSAGQRGFTIWPANANDSRFSDSAGGTEWLLSSMAGDGSETGNTTGHDHRLTLWAVQNTSTIDSATPALRLRQDVVDTLSYSLPPKADQKPGPQPLLECIISGCLPGVGPSPEVPYGLDSNDTRMQQVWYARGLLYGALDTAVNIGGQVKAGVFWFVIRPHSTSHGVYGTVYNQGKFGVNRNNVTYPAVAVNERGRGVMAMTLVGQDYYPSAAYALLDANGGVGPVQVAAPGVGPDDGFSGTAFFNAPNPPRPRWGDYGAASVDPNTQHIWIASEYIGQTCTLDQFTVDTTCGGTRTALANWYTRISEIAP